MCSKSQLLSGDADFRNKVHFDNTYGAYNRFEGIEGFEVAGEDKVFHKEIGRASCRERV